MERNAAIDLPQGRVHYRDAGSGEPLVFVHGLLVDGSLWRKVVPGLERDFRCIVPDWPLGSHREPMARDADLSPRGVAHLIADFLAALELERVTLVANDTGGAIVQLVATERPERLGRLVLTPCDAYENFLPPMFRGLQLLARVPGGMALALQPLRVRALRKLPMAYGMVTKYPLEPAVVDAWLAPALGQRAIRRDLAKLLRGITRRDTLAAAERLARFERPTLLAWAPEERTFPFAHAERLAATIPDARVERIDDALAFVPEDQPERVAQLIAEFVREPQPAPAA